MSAPDRCLFLFLQAAACSCRCRHCDFAVSSGLPLLPMERAVRFLQPFVAARDSGLAPYGHLAALLGDSPLNHPDLADGLRYLRQHEVEGWLSLPVNGFGFRPTEKWRPYLESIREAGTEYFEFTLYGGSDTHDWFARRRGDCDALHELARQWRTVSGKTIWSIFAHKRDVHEIGELRTAIRQEYGEESGVTLWDYLGHAAAQPAEDLRLEAADLDQADEATRADLAAARTEAEWREVCLDSAETAGPEEPRVVHLVADGEGRVSIPQLSGLQHGHNLVRSIGQLPVDSVGSLLAGWRRDYHAWRLSYPTVGVLARRYGDASGTRLYSRKSALAKWRSLHDRAS